jgi:hypothetical protein
MSGRSSFQGLLYFYPAGRGLNLGEVGVATVVINASDMGRGVDFW